MDPQKPQEPTTLPGTQQTPTAPMSSQTETQPGFQQPIVENTTQSFPESVPEPPAEGKTSLSSSETSGPPNKSNWLLIFVVILFVLALVGMAYFTLQNLQLRKKVLRLESRTAPTPILTEIPTPTPITDPTANWASYINNFEDYSIKYPETWFINPASAEGNGTDLSDVDLKIPQNLPKPDNTDHIRVNIIAFNAPNVISLEEWLKVNDKGKVYSESSVNLGGTNALVREESNSDFLQLGEISKAQAIYLIHQNKVYRIMTFPPDSKHKSVFDQILSTFKFLE